MSLSRLLLPTRPYLFSSRLMPALASSLERPSTAALDAWNKGNFVVNEDDKSYSLSIDLPGVKPDEMKMELANNGRLLHLAGGRKFVKDNVTTESKFEHHFTIGDNIDTNKLEARLEDGVLHVTAPKKYEDTQESRIIQIVEGKNTQAAEGEAIPDPALLEENTEKKE